MSNRIDFDLSRTVAALDAFDASDEGPHEDGPFGRAVGVAFGLDTADRNDPATCEACVRPGKRYPPGYPDESFVRRMVRLWREEQGS